MAIMTAPKEYMDSPETRFILLSNLTTVIMVNPQMRPKEFKADTEAWRPVDFRDYPDPITRPF
jgi:hypothetical protein